MNTNLDSVIFHLQILQIKKPFACAFIDIDISIEQPPYLGSVKSLYCHMIPHLPLYSTGDYSMIDEPSPYSFIYTLEMWCCPQLWFI